MVCCLLLIIIFPFSKGLLQLLANQANRQIVDMFGLADRENLIRKEETYYQETTNPQDCLMISTNHGGGGATWVNFCWVCVPLASQSPFPSIVYSVAKYRPILVTLIWEDVIFAIQT